jgi:uncharacterized membrane protein
VATSLVLLLVYVNRFTHSLRPVAVAAAVAAAGRRALGDQALLLPAQRPSEDDELRLSGEPSLTVRVEAGGALQAVSAKRLVAAAVQADCILTLVHGVGDFLPAGSAVLEARDIRSGEAPEARVLRGTIATGTERTIEQDPAFAVRILVDIAIRALSPAVNDPTTAVQVLDYIEDFLQTLAAMPLRSHYSVADHRGTTRVVVPGRGWTEFLSLAVTEIRLYGATSPQVCRRLRALLHGLLDRAPVEHRPAIAAEIARLDATVDQAYPDAATRAFASRRDRQGIGGRSSQEEVRGEHGRDDSAVPAGDLTPRA